MIDYKILIQTISLDSLPSMLTFIPQENKETMNRKLDEVMEKMLTSGYFENAMPVKFRSQCLKLLGFPWNIPSCLPPRDPLSATCTMLPPSFKHFPSSSTSINNTTTTSYSHSELFFCNSCKCHMANCHGSSLLTNGLHSKRDADSNLQYVHQYNPRPVDEKCLSWCKVHLNAPVRLCSTGDGQFAPGLDGEKIAIETLCIPSKNSWLGLFYTLMVWRKWIGEEDITDQETAMVDLL